MKVATSTAQKKAWKEKTIIMKSGFEELFRKNGDERSAIFERKFSNSPLSTLNVDALDKQLVAMCPYDVSERVMTKISEVHNLVQEFTK